MYKECGYPIFHIEPFVFIVDVYRICTTHLISLTNELFNKPNCALFKHPRP